MALARQIFLDPSTISLEANGKQTVYVTAVFRDSGGSQIIDGSASTFSIDNTTVATVDASGTVHAVAPGTATLTVTFAGKTATAAIIVTAY
jgi:uncharacterized protein YjdB